VKPGCVDLFQKAVEVQETFSTVEIDDGRNELVLGALLSTSLGCLEAIVHLAKSPVESTVCH